MKRVRAARKRHEQDEILEYVSKSYETFDEELDTLEKVRLEVVHESVYMNLYLLTMHQELIILKRFEGMENELSNNVKDKSRSKIKINKMIQKSVLRIDEKNNFIIKLQEKIKEIQMRYLNSVSENKFYIFFKRICKKKYKPPRPADASSSSESSEDESSSEEEEEEVDVGSSDEERDITLENLDENICPEGCNRNLYEEAFAVREKRYEMENRIKDELRLIETLQKDLDEKRKSLKTIEAELQTDQDKLETFLREKQRQLNDIDVTVILKLHQMQCFNEDDSAEKIQNCVVFDKVRLSQLYARVGELQNETAEQLTKHKNDRHRLTKMKADCESMKRELEDLKGEIKKEMTQKFGQQVSLVSLYEAVLRRLIYDIKADTSSLIKVYDEKIKNIKTEYKQNLQILKSLIEDNTQKLSFMTVLEEELLKLQKTLKVKLIPEEEITKIESQYECDLNKLKAMLKNQERQKEFYMKNLKRSKTLAPIDQSKSKVDKNRTILKFEEIEQDVIKYDEIDEKLSKEDTSVSQEPTFLMDDSEYYKKIIAIRHLLSQVATADEPNTKETVNRMLREITDKLQKAGYCKEEIEKNISDIMNVQYEHQDLSQVSSKETFETLSDIIHKHRSETRESTANEEIKREVRDILNDLFKSVGIEDEKGDVAQNIVHKLKKNKNINSALKYILQKLPSDTDDETKIALSKPIKQTLVKIIKHIEIEEIESVETQED